MDIIPKMEAGAGPKGTIREAKYANRIVEVCNAVIKAKVKHADSWKFAVTPDGVTLQTPPKQLIFGVVNGFGACWEVPAKEIPLPG